MFEIAVILVLDDDLEHLVSTTLDSVFEQTLEKDRYEVVLLDNANLRFPLLEYLSSAPNEPKYSAGTLRTVRSAAKLPEDSARLQAVKATDAPYVIFLAAGDELDRDYLKKCLLALKAAVGAGWCHGKIVNRGELVEINAARPFAVSTALAAAYAGHPIVFRRRPWLSAAHTACKTGKGRFYNPHIAVFLSLMGRGYYGLNLLDTASYVSVNRPSAVKEGILTYYVTLRYNAYRFFRSYRSTASYNKAYAKGYGYRAALSPLRVLDNAQRFFFKFLGRMITGSPVLNTAEFLRALFLPKRFVDSFLDPQQSLTLAEIICGFERKPRISKWMGAEGSGLKDCILFAQTNWTIGGAEKVLLEWVQDARACTSAKLIDVCERDRFGEFDPEVMQAFGELCDEQYNLDRIAETPLQRLAIFWELICRENPKIIFISGNAFAYALLPKIKEFFPDTIVVDVLHNEWKERGDWFDTSMEYRNYLDRRFVISEYWRSRLISVYHEMPSKIEIVKNSIDLTVFNPELYEAVAAKTKLGLPPHKTVVAFISRLYEQKRPAVFFELARLLSDEAYHFIVVGDGPLKTELLERFSGLDNLTYYGFSHEIPRFLAAADVFVCCSEFEGFPLNSLEAAAMGVPVIASDITGFREQITEGQFGLLFQPTGGDTQDARRIRDLLIRHKSDLMRLAPNGPAYVAAHHDRSILSEYRRKLTSQLMLHRRFVVPARSSISNRKTIYCHVGTGKTGSTSIQKFLYTNRKLLQQQGYHYPDSIVFGYAQHPVAWMIKKRPKFHRALADIFPTRDAWLTRMEAFRQELAQAAYRNIIISAEGIFSGEPEKLAEYFAGFDVKIIVLLRRQDYWLQSRYNQITKIGRKEYMTPAEWKRSKMKSGLYFEKLEKWANVFSRENMTVIPFERSAFPLGLERKFTDTVGLTWDPRFKISPAENTSLNRDCIDYLIQANSALKMPERKYRYLLNALEEYSRLHPDKPHQRHIYSPAERMELMEYYAESNSQVARHYLDREDGSLFEDATVNPDENWVPYKGLDREARNAIDRHLMNTCGFTLGVSPEDPQADPEEAFGISEMVEETGG